MQQFIPDLLVILAYFGVILTIGLSQRSKSQSVEGFALGDREIAWWAVLCSIIAAEISAATFLGAPGDGYTHRNWTYAQLAIGTLLARVVVSFIFIPVFYRQGVVSIYEFLGTRFGPKTRSLASATFLITRVLAMGTRLYVAAIIVVLAYELLVGQKADVHQQFVLYFCALVLISVATAIYTSVGGIRAVIWTDFIQVGILVSAMVFSIFFLLGKIPGGWTEIGAHIKPPYFVTLGAPKGEGVLGWIVGILTEPYTIWAAIIGSTFLTMATHGIDQDTVQRMLTAKNRRQSAFATIMSGVVDLPIVGSFILIGVMLSIYYSYPANQVANLPTDDGHVFPFFILNIMPAGLRGLVVAGVLATAMGSLSTALNAMATSFTRDFIFPRIPDASEKKRVWIMRGSTVFFASLIVVVGVGTAGFALKYPEVGIIGIVIGVLTYTFGSLLGIFLVAVFTKTRGSDIGNVIAMITGFLAVCYFGGVYRILLGLLLPDPDRAVPFEIAWSWRVLLGTLVTVAVALCFPTSVKRQEAFDSHPVTD